MVGYKVIDTVLMFLIIGLAYALLGIGLSIIYSSFRLLNVAYGDLAILAAYMVVLFSVKLNIAYLFSLVLSVLILFFVAILKFPFLWGLWEKSLGEIETNSLLVFFGLSLIIQNILSLCFGTRSVSYSYITGTVLLLGEYILINRVYVLFILTSVTISVIIFIYKTWVGTAIRWTIEDLTLNKISSRLAGANLKRVFLYSNIVAYTICAIVGSMLSVIYSINPTYGLQFTVISLIILTLSGIGNIKGCFVVGMVMSCLQTLWGYYFGQGLTSFLFYVVFLISVMIRKRVR